MQSRRGLRARTFLAHAHACGFCQKLAHPSLALLPAPAARSRRPSRLRAPQMRMHVPPPRRTAAAAHDVCSHAAASEHTRRCGARAPRRRSLPPQRGGPLHARRVPHAQRRSQLRPAERLHAAARARTGPSLPRRAALASIARVAQLTHSPPPWPPCTRPCRCARGPRASPPAARCARARRLAQRRRRAARRAALAPACSTFCSPRRRSPPPPRARPRTSAWTAATSTSARRAQPRAGLPAGSGGAGAESPSYLRLLGVAALPRRTRRAAPQGRDQQGELLLQVPRGARARASQPRRARRATRSRPQRTARGAAAAAARPAPRACRARAPPPHAARTARPRPGCAARPQPAAAAQSSLQRAPAS
jgi:hypothetical protein